MHLSYRMSPGLFVFAVTDVSLGWQSFLSQTVPTSKCLLLLNNGSLSSTTAYRLLVDIQLFPKGKDEGGIALDQM